MATTTTTAPVAPSAGGPLYIDTQHDDMVHDAQMDYYGCKLATSSSDRTIKIYNVSGGGGGGNSSYEHTATLQGHEGPVWQVSWAHPMYGVLLGSCGFDGTVLIHRETRPRDWSLIYHSKGLHESSVNSLAFAPHELGLRLAAASSDGKVSVLTHQPDQSWTVHYLNDSPLGVNAVSWAPAGAYYSPDDNQLDETAATATTTAATDDNPDATAPTILPLEQARLVTGGCDNRIRFWIQNSPTGTWEEDASSPISKELCHSDWVRDVAWAPPLIPNQNVVASCSEDKTVLIWTQQSKGGHWKPTLLHEFDAPVWRVSWSLTTHMLAVSSGDNDVTLWRAGLDGSWSQMSTATDAAPAAAAEGAM
eukprot:CAMPEP_0119013832 /NCGR_PEP_ID=MMETSP1176-20130426/9068_1 /TAXON_ID=265551 /ORGANISM="Synedropsis recta cf, Strain CCMP1620" /LENGTH=362 /DNA_ID=CAMNT_0006966951 /DNA_START=24 /DNA_END=1112 /DNA_ORIENTATION=+